MNEQNARLFIPLVQALAEGKTIQYCGLGNGTWVDLNVDSRANVHFDGSSNQYRIKPDPPIKIEVWVNLYGNVLLGKASAMNSAYYASREQALAGRSMNNYVDTIKLTGEYDGGAIGSS